MTIPDLGRVGLWTATLDPQPASRAQELAAEIEQLGYGAVWLPEALNRDPFVHAALLLGSTRRLAVCTGIASIWARTAAACKAAQHTLAEAHPNRFLLGLGVSHQPMVEGIHRRGYAKPYTAMVDYLDGLDQAPFMAAAPPEEPGRVLAALGPRMLALSRDRADGAHPYLQTPEHTARAREVLGPGPLLAPELMAVLDTDAAAARDTARKMLAVYLGPPPLPNYANNLRSLGFGDDDLADGGSDRLVDALVAHGDVDEIRARVAEHFDAGADHVAVQVIPPGLFTPPPVEEWRELAPALTSV